MLTLKRPKRIKAKILSLYLDMAVADAQSPRVGQADHEIHGHQETAGRTVPDFHDYRTNG